MARRLPYPDSKEMARKYQVLRWVDLNGCKRCGAKQAQRFIEDDSCVDCLQQQFAIEIHASPYYSYSRVDAIEKGFSAYYDHDQVCPKGPHPLYRDVRNGHCLTCKEQNNNRAKAQRAGQKYFYPSEPCPGCSRKVMRTTDTDECTKCNPEVAKEKSAPLRDAAKKRGDIFYLPSYPCGLCGSRKVRRVFDDKCKCEYDKEPKRNGPSPLTARQRAHLAKRSTYISPEPCAACGECLERLTATGACPCGNRRPEFVPPDRHNVAHVLRRHAEALGFKYYQTTQPCIRGHIDPRYVSTGVCMRCVWESSDKR